MKQLIIDNGLKSFEVADKDGNIRGVITFNPADFGFIERSKKVAAEIEAYSNNIPENVTEEILTEADCIIRQKINTLFGSDDVSDVIFGKINCLSFSGGIPLFRKALDVLIPFVRKNIEEEFKKGEKNMEKYTKGVVNT